MKNLPSPDFGVAGERIGTQKEEEESSEGSQIFSEVETITLMKK